MPNGRKRIIGVTRVSVGWKIGFLKDVATILKAGVGDKVVYIEEDGRVYMEKV